MPQIVSDIISTDNAVATNEKRLSICLRSNGFSFSIVTTDGVLLTCGEVDAQQPLSPSDLTNAVIQAIGESDAPLVFKEMRLIIPTMQFAWIPAHLYDQRHDRQYLAAITKLSETDVIYRSFSKSLDSYLIFTAPSAVVNAFKIALPGIDIVCQHHILSEIVANTTSRSHPLMLLYLRPQAADIEAFYNGRLLLSSSRQAQNEDEILYHTINVMKHLHLETPDMELSICGQVDRDTFARFQHFFPNVLLYTGKPHTYHNPDFQTLHTYKHALILS